MFENLFKKKSARSKVKEALDVKTNTELKRVRSRSDMEGLKEKLELQMEMQRRIMNHPDTSPRQKELAESKIVTAMCAHSIVRQGIEQMDEAATELDLNNILNRLEKNLKYISRMDVGASRRRAKSMDKSVKRMKGQGESTRIDRSFTADAQEIVSNDWMGMQFEDVARKYIAGEDLDDCIREAQNYTNGRSAADAIDYFTDNDRSRPTPDSAPSGKPSDWLDLSLFD